MDDVLSAYVAALLEQANASNIPSGILHWSSFDPYRIASFDGEEWRGECDQDVWMQLYHELHAGVKGDSGMTPLGELTGSLAEWHDRQEVPIAIACYRYDTPKRSFVARVIRTAQTNEVLPQPESEEPILDQKTAFFASALLPAQSHAFDFLPYEHEGLDATFVVPRRLFVSNLDGEPSALEIDFDDGEGFRSVPFDEPVRVRYGDELRKHLRLRLSFDHRSLGASFGLGVRAYATPEHTTWPFTEADVRPYERKFGTGWAWVFPRTGSTGQIVNPMIFADGFGEGSSSVHKFWELLDKQGLASRLRDAGNDLILVGYYNRSQYIQANAMLVVAVIQRILRERQGRNPLFVAGASMGGLVTRYALMWMKDTHETTAYLSYDTPHDGAWTPLIVQKFVHFFRPRNAELEAKAKLLTSPAAQQLLWAWTPDARIEPENYRGNGLRATFYKEMADLGGMPRMTRYAVANGAGDGQGNRVVEPDFVALEWWEALGVYGADLRTQPLPGPKRNIGRLKAGLDDRWPEADQIPAFDGAPGGRDSSFRQVYDGLRRRGSTPILRVGETCFIPSVSAVASSQMEHPFTDLSRFPRSQIPFHDFEFSWNGMHVEVTPALRDWVVSKFRRNAEVEPEHGRAERDGTRGTAPPP